MRDNYRKVATKRVDCNGISVFSAKRYLFFSFLFLKQTVRYQSELPAVTSKLTVDRVFPLIGLSSLMARYLMVVFGVIT